jgi:hypothetical protein
LHVRSNVDKRESVKRKKTYARLVFFAFRLVPHAECATSRGTSSKRELQAHFPLPLIEGRLWGTIHQLLQLSLQICIPGESGRLFTLFLTSPVTAMAALVKLEKPDGLLLATCQVGPPLQQYLLFRFTRPVAPTFPRVVGRPWAPCGRRRVPGALAEMTSECFFEHLPCLILVEHSLVSGFHSRKPFGC